MTYAKSIVYSFPSTDDLLLLGTQHVLVKLQEFQIAAWSCVVVSSHFVVESISHSFNAL